MMLSRYIQRTVRRWGPATQYIRSSHRRRSIKKSVLKVFTKFTGKHLCQSLFFNKVADLTPATLLKKRLWHRYFSVNFVKFLRTPFFIEHLRWLLLDATLKISNLIGILNDILFTSKFIFTNDFGSRDNKFYNCENLT